MSRHEPTRAEKRRWRRRVSRARWSKNLCRETDDRFANGWPRFWIIVEWDRERRFCPGWELRQIVAPWERAS